EPLPTEAGYPALHHLQAPHRSRAPVAVVVAPAEVRPRLAPVDEAARHRAPEGVGVDLHRRPVRAARIELAAAVERCTPLVDRPAEVLDLAEFGPGHVVDLLPGALSDVGDVQVAVRPVERE